MVLLVLCGSALGGCWRHARGGDDEERCLRDLRPPRTEPGDIPIGPPRPTIVLASSSRFRWAVLAQAHEDPSQSRPAALGFGHHGVVIGERRLTYFDAHHPDGIAIDAAIDVSPREHQVAVAIDGELLVLDAQRGSRWSAGPLGPWPSPTGPFSAQTVHTLGARRDAGFVDEERVIVLTGDNQLEVRDITGGRRPIAPMRRSPLSRVDVSAGWVFVRVTSEDAFTWAEQHAMYGDIDHRFPSWEVRLERALQRRDYRGDARDADVQWWAVHIESGLTVELGAGVGWPAAWGLVKRSGEGTLSLVLLDGREVVVASDCSPTDFVVPGIEAVGVIHACGGHRASWVGVDGVSREVGIHPRRLAISDERVRRGEGRVVRALRMDGVSTHTDAGSYALRGVSFLVAPDSRQIWPDDRDADRLGWVHDRREAPNGFFYADTLRSPEGTLYRRDPSWHPVPDPVDERECLDGYELAPALWGQCIAVPAVPLPSGSVDAEGWAIVTRGEWRCRALGALQPVWANLLDPR